MSADNAGMTDADLIHADDRGKLRSRHVTMITLGGIIGASLFVGSGNIVRAVGPAAVLSYLIGGLLVFLAMRMLGEMAAARPVVGSFMEYAREGLGDWAAYIVGWLVMYSGGLGSVAAVMIVDYWVIRKRKLRLLDLYLPDGCYRYERGFNRAAVWATLGGCVLAWGGLVVPSLRPLFDFAWFVGFLGAGVLYYGLMQSQRAAQAH